MFDERIYLDHNATTPVRPEVAAALGRALVAGGNPSSVHSEGRRARAAVERAREAVAALVRGRAKNVTFTSGATEALNLALTPTLQFGRDERRWHLFAGATEHAAVLSGHRFAPADATVLPVDGAGLLDLDALTQSLDGYADRRPLLALQLANNETGVIQPFAEAARLVHERGGLVLCDAVQAVSYLDVDIENIGADLLVISAHKIGGPPGVGALIRADGGIHIAEAVVRGGGQEKGFRAGTENVPGIVGFGAAAELVFAERVEAAARLAELSERFQTELRGICGDAIVFGEGAKRLPNTIAFALPGLAAETALIALDLAGFALSSGSACSSGKVKSSHVLDAMGVSTDIRKCMLRASFGWTTRRADVDGVIAAIGRLHAKVSMAGKILAA